EDRPELVRGVALDVSRVGDLPGQLRDRVEALHVLILAQSGRQFVPQRGTRQTRIGKTTGAGTVPAGRRTTNVVPRPTSLVTSTEPPIASASSFTIARPRPVPSRRPAPCRS